ncbi:HAMP domain-containing sensor histidine kinase [Paenibacillus sp. GYB004]|uniref:HAMP domain-containing sensor histidine kinase n=1 Tax=Paenibacillus sp. GYB004 TaxID=2994393 RepID=UPI002F965893
MEQIKRMLGQRSVLLEFMLIAIVLGMLAVYLSVITVEEASDAYMNLEFSYSDKIPYNEIKTKDGYTVREYPYNKFPYFTTADKVKSILYQVLPFIAVPVYVVGLLGSGMFYYYKRRVKTPYDLMIASSRKIAEQDLDFEIRYESKDEFGKLCAAFEKMRAALAQNTRDMWRTAEERKRLNAAFSHDLRTPLTVLKGHVDYLKRYYPDEQMSKEDVLSTINTMKGHIERLERYVASMNSIQKLEEVRPSPAEVSARELLSGLRETAVILCDGKQLSFEVNATADTVRLDPEMVSQVVENLIVNAARYAKQTVAVTGEITGTACTLSVTDDGAGFSARALKKAAEPFYRDDHQAGTAHFGLGLYIGKLLCEKHGGQLIVANSPSGGAQVTARFRSL